MTLAVELEGGITRAIPRIFFLDNDDNIILIFNGITQRKYNRKR